MQQLTDINRRAVLASVLGATATLAFATPASAQQPLTEAEKTNVKIVNDFVAAFSSRDMNKVLPYLADDAVYRMTETTPPATGHEAIRARLGPFVESSEKVDWQVLDTYARGPMVITHRIDRFVNPTRPLTWEGVGVFFITNGKIKEWHDYTIRTQR
jgi:limonene-1,2-epoxide hydrolase